MVVLDLLTDVFYDRLKLDQQQAIPQRDQCDITFLYQQLYSLKIHLLSKGRYGGHWVDILSTHTNVDDIERVRLLRNEMQHSKAFSLDDVD